MIDAPWYRDPIETTAFNLYAMDEEGLLSTREEKIQKVIDYLISSPDPNHKFIQEQALISAKPKEHPLENKKHILLEGDIPNAVDIPEGCRFAGRCRYFKEGLCDNRTPKLKDIGNGHYVACHFPLGIDRSKTAADM